MSLPNWIYCHPHSKQIKLLHYKQETLGRVSFDSWQVWHILNVKHFVEMASMCHFNINLCLGTHQQVLKLLRH